jgi:hypothetical protein
VTIERFMLARVVAAADSAVSRSISWNNLPWDGDLRHLEDDIASVAHHLRADLDQLLFKLVSDQSLIGSGVASAGARRPSRPHTARRPNTAASTSRPALAAVPAGSRISEYRHLRQAECIVEFAVCQQFRVRRDRGPTKLEHLAALKSSRKSPIPLHPSG